MATGLEIGVQLRGEWKQRGGLTGQRLYQPGDVHVLSPGELYDFEFSASREENGLQVGFILYPDELAGFAPRDHDLAFVPGTSAERSFFDFCRAFQHQSDRGEPLPWGQVRAAILDWVRARVTAVQPDPLIRAKRALDRDFASPLYVRHVAEVAEMNPIPFTRKFARRFGLTPVAYRHQLRLNEAARLTWSEPSLTTAAIAARVGFADLPYFFRSFRRAFGLTPSDYGHRQLGT